MSADGFDWGLKKCELEDGPSSDLIYPPYFGDLGGDVSPGKGTLTLSDILEVSVSQAPFVVKLSDLYLLGHHMASDSKERQSLKDYEYWMVMHVVNVVRRDDGLSIGAVGYHADIQEDSPAVTVDLAPQTQMIDRNGAQLTVDVEGVFGPAKSGGKLLSKVWTLADLIGVRLSGNAHLVGAVNLASKVAQVTAAGIGQPWSDWRFCDHGVPLDGDHIMLQTIRVPIGTESVKCSVRAYIQIAKWYDWFNWTRTPRLKWTEAVEAELKPVGIISKGTTGNVAIGQIRDVSTGTANAKPTNKNEAVTTRSGTKRKSRGSSKQTKGEE